MNSITRSPMIPLASLVATAKSSEASSTEKPNAVVAPTIAPSVVKAPSAPMIPNAAAASAAAAASPCASVASPCISDPEPGPTIVRRMVAVATNTVGTNTTPDDPHEGFYVAKPGPNDVLCGRGGATNNHDGNRMYRTLVQDHQETYLKAVKKNKKGIAKAIVAIVRSRGGGFLKRADDGRQGWVDVGDKKAWEKTSQALREGLDAKSLLAKGIVKSDVLAGTGNDQGTADPSMPTKKRRKRNSATTAAAAAANGSAAASIDSVVAHPGAPGAAATAAALAPAAAAAMTSSASYDIASEVARGAVGAIGAAAAAAALAPAATEGAAAVTSPALVSEVNPPSYDVSSLDVGYSDEELFSTAAAVFDVPPPPPASLKSDCGEVVQI